jgi:ribonuclease D
VTATLPGHEGDVTGTPAAAPDVELLLAPREGVPPVVTTAAALDDVVQRFADGTGPVAVDAERASGYRYSQRAYLVQLRRAGAGSALVDPIACPDLSGLSDALLDAEWVLHAANQDLPCLAEVGMAPSRLFDTELAGRLAGFERVGLGAMVENVLGYRLEKGHSAADWSTRPLPQDWLVYAALDVEVLVELRDALEAELRAQGKLDWAHEEFEAVRCAPPPGPRDRPVAPHLRHPPAAHPPPARRRARAVGGRATRWPAAATPPPGRILPDAAIVAAVTAAPRPRGAARAAGVRRPVHPPARRHLVRRAAQAPRAARRPAAAARPAGDAPPPPTAGPSATRWPPGGWPAPAAPSRWWPSR